MPLCRCQAVQHDARVRTATSARQPPILHTWKSPGNTPTHVRGEGSWLLLIRRAAPFPTSPSPPPPLSPYGGHPAPIQGNAQGAAIKTQWICCGSLRVNVHVPLCGGNPPRVEWGGLACRLGFVVLGCGWRRGWGGWLSTDWGGGEGGGLKTWERRGPAHDATVTGAPDTPGIAPDSPGLTPDTPGLTPDTPGVAQEPPGLASDSAGVAPDSPGIALDTPGGSPGLTRASATRARCAAASKTAALCTIKLTPMARRGRVRCRGGSNTPPWQCALRSPALHLRGGGPAGRLWGGELLLGGPTLDPCGPKSGGSTPPQAIP